MLCNREALQHPSLNNESCLGKAPGPQKLLNKKPTHLAQKELPWSRLSRTGTVTTLRRNVNFFDPTIPEDDLDFRLSALYDHHSGTFKDKSEILLQQETIQKPMHGMQTEYTGECSSSPAPPITSHTEIRQWVNPTKDSIHSIQGAIVSPHTAATNGGFSRKNDGGFFST